ncbi:MAG: shikimate dehydrogenase [Bacteroidetes bacterium]|nr:shikimate dehydrogenase [Rhodothermia bacterium]MCS7154192.1 shikimate dehydrogenase [Bacteroidota bacterium]MCX7906772.1 shikimate dehydrogenase [Bacteroidota bacterium]MDW8136948.1 shikimate dehydrogenase [Bacteroidota bacterium]MDW8285181.1 shikimate dehydrogenase [Bacteroidota bacterium]
MAAVRYVALIGHPVDHSLSPLLHNTAFRHHGLPYEYLLLDVTDPARLPAVLLGLWAMDFRGANVTIPYKEAVLPWVDALSDTVQAVGAANTIVNDGNRLWAENTDVWGFVRALAPYEDRISGGGAVVFGSGGAARAVVYGLLTAYRVSRITLVARNLKRASALKAHLEPYGPAVSWRVCSWAEARQDVQEAQLLVNATPLGMSPQEDGSPWTDPSAYRPGQIAFDLVYRPRLTHWLREASASGVEIVDGLAMLVHQAAASYTLWTGREMPLEVVSSALDGLL